MAYWWKPAIVSMPSMTQTVSARGGFIRIEWGNISFAPNAFTGEPPAKAEISLDYGLDSSRALHIFDGTIIRREWTDRDVPYDLYEPEYATKLLDEGLDEQATLAITACASADAGAKTQITTNTPHGYSAGTEIYVQDTADYNGAITVDSIVSTTDFVLAVAYVSSQTGECSTNVVARPLVIGTVAHMAPQRTGFDTEEKYYLPAFASANYYDGGVLINDHWTDNGDGTVSRSITILDGLTLSGSGTMTTLADVFTWAAARMGLTLSNLHGADEAVNHVVYTNELLIDFLDKLAYYCGYMFWIRNGVLYLANVDQDNGVQVISDADRVEKTYSWRMPVKKYLATWTQKQFDAATIGLVDDPRRVAKYTDNAIGEETTLSAVYDEAVADVAARIDAIAVRDALPVIKLKLPLDRIPNPGERLEFNDTKDENDITGYLRMQKYSINYQSKTLDIEGPGEITVS